MGRSTRPKPRYLASKLKRLRIKLELSQDEMVKRLNYTEGFVSRSHISEFERGKREPSLPLLVRYARLAGLTVDELVDDDSDLPDGF